MRTNRTLALAALTVLLTTMLAACGSSSSSPGVAAGCTTKYASQLSSANLVLPGKLTVATDATYPPQETVDTKTGKYVGMEIDLANEFAKRLCLASNIQNVQFSTIIAGITYSSPGSQYYDMSISAWTINSSRQQVVDMIPYFQAGESLLVPKGNPKGITGKSSLCGLNVAVEAGTVEEGEIDGTQATPDALNNPGGACVNNKVKLFIFPTQNQVIQALLSGNADASYQDSPVSAYDQHLYPDKLDVGPITVQPSPEGIVVRKDNATFENIIKSVLADMRADGTYLSILNTWGLASGAYPPCTASSCP